MRILDPSRIRISRLRIAVWLVAFLVIVELVARLANERPPVWDDAYIVARYARNLVETGALRWNPTRPPVYGLTGLAYVVPVALALLVAGANVGLALIVVSCASMISFLLLLTWLLAWGVDGTARTRRWSALLVLIGLTGGTSLLADHAGSGMDTAFALCYATALLAAAVALERQGTWLTALVLGALGGLALAIRPELALLAIVLPLSLAWMATDTTDRCKALTAFACTLGFYAGHLWLATRMLHSPLPLPFYVKGIPGFYGPAFTDIYHQVAIAQLRVFAAAFWPLIALAAARLVTTTPGNARAKALELGIAATILVHCAYHALITVAVMPMSARFFMPVLPGLAFLAGRAAASMIGDIPDVSKHALGVAWSALPRRQRVAMLALSAVLLAVRMPVPRELVAWARNGQEVVARWHPDKAYESWSQLTWYRLDRVCSLTNSIEIAATEVGLPGVLCERIRIIDLAGLNEPAIASGSASAAEFVMEAQPDLIYMPHPHYRPMIKAIRAHPRFRREYVEWSTSRLDDAIQRSGSARAKSLLAAGNHVLLGVAVREESPHFDDLIRVLDAE